MLVQKKRKEKKEKEKERKREKEKKKKEKEKERKRLEMADEEEKKEREKEKGGSSQLSAHSSIITVHRDHLTKIVSLFFFFLLNVSVTQKTKVTRPSIE